MRGVAAILRWSGLAVLTVLVALAAIGLVGHLRAMGTEPIYKMVEVAPGRALHAGCEGPVGAPPVIYDAGAFGIYADGWWVKEALKSDFRVCLYDRAGMGQSDAVPDGVAPSPDFHVEDMRRLASSLDLAPPYYIVGHSMAGLRLHAYAALHPEDLAGVVFVDAAAPDRLRDVNVERFVKRARQAMAVAITGADFGLGRVAAELLPDPLTLPKTVARSKKRSIASPRHYRATRAEVLAVGPSAPYFRNLEANVGLPIAVFDRTVETGGNTAIAEATAAKGGFGQVTVIPDATHVTLLAPGNAEKIGEAVRAMHQFNLNAERRVTE